MSVVVGIDADTRGIAYAWVIGPQVRYVGTIPRTNTRGRFEECYDADLTALVRDAQDFGARISLEGIYLPEPKGADNGTRRRNVATFQALSEVAGEIKREARRHGVRLTVVSANHWQSRVLGFTRGTDQLKAAAMTKAKQVWAGELTQHEADAVCIAWSAAMEVESCSVA